MSADSLRALVEAATPGPWEWEDDGGNLLAAGVSMGVIDNADDARLLALAPEMATLLADMGDYFLAASIRNVALETEFLARLAALTEAPILEYETDSA